VNQTFTVYASPTISGTPTVCIGLTTALTGSATPNATTFGCLLHQVLADKSSSQTGIAAGHKCNNVPDSNGCTITQTVTVNALPTITGTPTICVGSTTTLTGSVTPNATNPGYLLLQV
jgi:hypothetical protein